MAHALYSLGSFYTLDSALEHALSHFDLSAQGHLKGEVNGSANRKQTLEK